MPRRCDDPWGRQSPHASLPSLACGLGLGLLVLLGQACDSGPRVMEVTQMKMPPGGNLYQVVELQDGRRVGVGDGGLFGWDDSERAWDRMETINEQGVPLKAQIEETGWEEAERRHMVARGDRLWWLHSSKTEGYALWQSMDKDLKLWQRIQLPLPYQRNKGAAFFESQDLSILANLRLMQDPHSREVFLLDSAKVWRWGGEAWAELDLSGTGIGQISGRERLPTVLRHYLPRTATRDFELLATLGQQLSIYRRQTPDAPWLLTTTLGVLSQDLYASPDGATLYLLTHDSLYRSGAEAETWERLSTKALPEGVAPQDQAADFTHLLVKERPARGQDTLVVASADGQILRSADSGATWQALKESAHQAPITGLQASDHTPGLMWATLEGHGVLASNDDGRTWTLQGEGLSGNLISSMALAQKRLYAGDAAGLHELELGNDLLPAAWRTIHRYPTTAVASRMIEPLEEGKITVPRHLSGTPMATVVMASPPLDDAPRPLSLYQGSWPQSPLDVRLLYYPSWQSSRSVHDRAIMDFHAPEDQSVWIGLTTDAQMVVTKDRGETWDSESLALPLQEVLSGTRITDFEVVSAQHFYLTNQPLETHDGLARVWQTKDGGGTWHALLSFEGEEAHGWLSLEEVRAPGASLVLARHRTLMVTDKEEGRWRTLRGPWEQKEIVGTGVDQGKRLLLLTRDRDLLELYEIEDFSQRSPQATHAILSWPKTHPVPFSTQLVMDQGTLYVKERGMLWRARRVTRGAAQNQSVTLLLLLAAALSLSAVSYAGLQLVIRRQRRRLL